MTVLIPASAFLIIKGSAEIGSNELICDPAGGKAEHPDGQLHRTRGRAGEQDQSSGA